jgi:ABC-type glutathione transport system ATPase component
VAVWGQGKIAALGPPSRILNDPEVQRTVTATRSAKRPTTSMSCSTNTAVTPASRRTRTRVSTTDVRADALNEGARKLVDIAMAVALRPRLLLMDEPPRRESAGARAG